LKLVFESANDWLRHTDNFFAKMSIIGGEAGLVLLLITTTLFPIVQRKKEKEESIHETQLIASLQELSIQPFTRIALALDYSDKDKAVIQYALQFARENTEFVLIHIVESASAKMIGEDAEDYETRKDKEKLNTYAQLFNQQHRKATPHLGYRNRSKEIKRIVEETNADLLILGSHGHGSIKDLFFGETINRVRHLVKVPIFVAT
jgi:manganese transport protein